MAKVTFVFDMDEDIDELVTFNQAKEMSLALWNIQQDVRQIWKYEELSDAEYDLVDRVYSIINRNIDERKIELL